MLHLSRVLRLYWFINISGTGHPLPNIASPNALQIDIGLSCSLYQVNLYNRPLLNIGLHRHEQILTFILSHKQSILGVTMR